MPAEIDDTYAEAFDGVYSRVILTADDEKMLKKASEDATATPAIVIRRIEGGIEKWLDKKETPDHRKGAILQFWGGVEEKRPLNDSVERFEMELSYRIRQDILVKPFTALFDALPNPIGKMDMMKRVGHCGDGFEWENMLYGRRMIVIPLMVPDFLIEHYIGYAIGVMGANFWYMCETKEAVSEAGRKAIEAISQIDGVVSPFEICSAGSKPETTFSWIGPTTNHPYCPTLRERLGEESKVPKGVNFIPEVVINGVSMGAVKQAMKVGIQSVSAVQGVVRISAGNFGGKLGKYKIYLKELST